MSCFDFEVVHRPGKSNIADYLSRHPDPDSVSSDEWLSEEFVNFVVNTSIPKSFTREQIVKETNIETYLLQLVKSSLGKTYINNDDRRKLGVYH